MSSAESLQRPLVLSLAVTAAVAVGYLLYLSSGTTHTAGLHRSNAIRRPRRQHAQANLNALHAQQGTDEHLLSPSRIDAVISQLSYGQYQNETILRDIEPDALPPLDLHILNLPHIYQSLVAIRDDLDATAKYSLYQHLLAMYVLEFTRSFFSEGHQFSESSRNALSQALEKREIPLNITLAVLDGFSAGTPVVNPTWDPTHLIDPDVSREVVAQVDGVADDPMSLDEAVRDDDDDEDSERAHNMLDLLYNIARKQANRHGHIHRGVECNSCGVCPIQGVRYHCTNCFDYDLCETCEAKEVHIKTHTFLKVTVPAPARGQMRTTVPTMYTGKPNAFPPMIPLTLLDTLKRDTGLDQPDIQGLYEQYKCLAGYRYEDDPAQLGTVVDREAFESYFIPSYIDRPTPANLIYERIFAFYDANADGYIDFLEFVRGITKLNDKSFNAKVTRIFRGHDLDGDGYVNRKDCLRMLRAQYDLQTQQTREMLHRHDELDLVDEIRENVNSNHPISAAFGGNNFPGHLSRGGQDKQRSSNGDLHIIGGPNGVLQNDLDLTSMRHRAVGSVPYEARERHPFRSFREPPPRDEDVMHMPFTGRNGEFLSITNAEDASEEEIGGSDPPLQYYGWPPVVPLQPEDVRNALGVDIPLDQIDDPVDRSRVVYAQAQRIDNEYSNRRNNARVRAVNDRWRRRQFYLDEEEGMTRPATYAEPDSSENESEPEPETIDSPRNQPLRSRSSSKVRFEDSAIDTDYETRSNASSRSVPQNERWGGFELSRPTYDIGADVLYEAVQQGMNQLIDCIFKEKEDQAIEAQKTRKQRVIWEQLLDEYAENRDLEEEERDEALLEADRLRTEEMLNAGHEQTIALNITSEIANPSALSNVVMHVQSEFNRVFSTVANFSDAPVLAEPQPTERRDPTLPQFRPNDDAKKGPAGSRKDSEPVRPSRKTLALWLKHRTIEAEAEARGGYGLLNLLEFRKAVETAIKKDNEEPLIVQLQQQQQQTPEQPVPTDTTTGDGAAAASSSSSAPAESSDPTPNNSDAQNVGVVAVETDENAQPQEYAKNHDLGKLAFLGTWIEMALL